MKLEFKIVLLLASFVAFSAFALPQELRRSGFLGIVAAPLTEEARKQLGSEETDRHSGKERFGRRFSEGRGHKI